MTLNLTDLDHMKRDFPDSSEQFYQKMMQQTKNLLVDHLATLQSNRDYRYTIKQFRSPVKGEKSAVNKEKRDQRPLMEANMSQVAKMKQDRAK